MKTHHVLCAVVAAVIGQASAQEVSHITAEDLKQFILTKPFVVIREKDSASVRFTFQADGTVYQNTARQGQSTISSSGTWQLNDKSTKVCLEFSAANSKGGCFGLMREGDQTRFFTGPQKSPVVWGTVKAD